MGGGGAPVHRLPCNAPIASLDIQHALQLEAGGLLALYTRWVALDSPNTVECPFEGCTALLSSTPSAPPDVHCSACGRGFCFHHGAAHLGASCAQFDAQHAQEEHASRVAQAKDGVKPCPGCHSPSFKFEGCNHMTCPRCPAHWCYSCGVRMNGGGWEEGPSVTQHFAGSQCRQFDLLLPPMQQLALEQGQPGQAQAQALAQAPPEAPPALQGGQLQRQRRAACAIA